MIHVDKVEKTYERAVALLEGEIQTDGATLPAKPSFFVRRRLQTALALLEDVLRAAPDHVHALFYAAKVHQRLGNLDEACDLLEAAHRGDPTTASYAGEAASVAVQLGRSQLLARDAPAAAHAFRRAQNLGHPRAPHLLAVADAVQSGALPCPATDAELEKATTRRQS